VVEDQVGLETCIVEKEAPAQLGKMMSILRHVNLLPVRFRHRLPYSKQSASSPLVLAQEDEGS
jgi:hypothetical protein